MALWQHYEDQLALKDVAPATKARYLQIVRAFREWLGGEYPTVELARLPEEFESRFWASYVEALPYERILQHTPAS